jgi:hypothetical protein
VIDDVCPTNAGAGLGGGLPDCALTFGWYRIVPR